MSFWSTATDEQKLQQIDAAVSLGLTSKQVAMNCGTDFTRVLYFAGKHGRKFGRGEEWRRKAAINVSNGSVYRSLQRLKDNSERYGTMPVNSNLAYIFPREQHNNLFEPHPYD